MKRALFPALLLLAACGQPHGEVQLTSSTPLRPQDQDLRGARGFCGVCGTTVQFGAKKCASKKCGASLVWEDTFSCGFCTGTGTCRACDLLGQKEQRCFNCRGEGFLVYQGRTASCSQCEGTGSCRICKDQPGACDACDGSKKLTQAQIQEYSSARSKEPESE